MPIGPILRALIIVLGIVAGLQPDAPRQDGSRASFAAEPAVAGGTAAPQDAASSRAKSHVAVVLPGPASPDAPDDGCLPGRAVPARATTPPGEPHRSGFDLVVAAGIHGRLDRPPKLA